MNLLSKLLIVCVVGLAGCAMDTEVSTRAVPGTPLNREGQGSEDGVSYWDGDGVTGHPSIKIDLENQRAYFYKGNQMVGVSVVSTGREGYNTPPGEFRVVQKDVDHASSLYGDYVDRSGQVVERNVELGKDPRPRGTVFQGAPMPHFLRIQGGIGMHAGYLPGYPASHGCIRLPHGMAVKFFEDAPVGTPVVIR
jgi:lipoprotein-anchoring transpeptidase ErfK/SrfK